MTRALAFLVVAVPSLALAGSSSDASLVRMDVGGGLVGAWAGMTKGIAFSFLPFLFIVSMAAEAWGKGPAEPRDFGKVVQRFIVIFVLLSFYGQIFGSLAGMLNGAANSIAPTETWAKLQEATKAFLEAKAQYQDREMGGTSGAGNTAMQWVAGQVDALGGTLIDSAVTLIVLGGQAAFRIVGTLGAVLSGLLYVLGPLAIAASMPASSDAGTKWLRVFVSVLSWPLISSVLVGLLTGYALQALKPNDSYEAAYSSIVLAGILTVTAFAVPVVASALTGAGMGAVGAGWSSLNAWSGAAATAGAAMAGGGAAAGMLQRAPSAAPMPQGGGGGGGGGGAGGGGLQSSAPSAGVGGGDWSARERDLNPAWAAKASVGSIAPAQAAVSPARDVAAAAEIANGGGVNFPPSEPAQPQPPPVAWSQGGIVPGGPDDSTPTQKPSPAPLPGPAARPTPPTRPGQRAVGVLQNASAPRVESPRKELAHALPKGAEEAFQKWAAQNPGKDWREHRQEILDLHQGGLRRGGLQQAAPSPAAALPTKPLNKKS